MKTNTTPALWRRITATAIGASAIAVGALAMGAPTANALTFEQSCTTQPGAYAAGAVLGVFSAVRNGNNRDETCKVYDAANKHLGTIHETKYDYYWSKKPVVTRIPSPPQQQG